MSVEKREIAVGQTILVDEKEDYVEDFDGSFYFLRDSDEPILHHTLVDVVVPGPTLYVLANVNENNEVTGFPQGGGSSTQPRIKAYDSLASARRGLRHHAGVIVRVTEMEVVR